MPYTYLKDPAAIYRLSFDLIVKEADLSGVPNFLRDVAIRLIHACGMPEIVSDLRWQGEVVEIAKAALAKGAPILCDARMVVEGILKKNIGNSDILCPIADPAAADLAAKRQTTRSSAIVDLWADRLHGGIIVIGNAPTALYRLMERMEEEGVRPAAIFAFPVGFVGAAESKESLIASNFQVPFLTLRGRRGGSAMAAAAINAITDAGGLR